MPRNLPKLAITVSKSALYLCYDDWFLKHHVMYFWLQQFPVHSCIVKYHMEIDCTRMMHEER